MSRATARKYSGLQRTFKGFCQTLNLTVVPATEATLVSYLTYLKLGRNLGPTSIRSYLSAIRHLHVINGLPDPLLDRPRLALIRAAATKGGAVTPARTPISFETLILIHARVIHPRHTACCFVAFFGFLRVSEFAAACIYPVQAWVLKKTSGSPDVFQHQEATCCCRLCYTP